MVKKLKAGMLVANVPQLNGKQKISPQRAAKSQKNKTRMFI